MNGVLNSLGAREMIFCSGEWWRFRYAKYAFADRKKKHGTQYSHEPDEIAMKMQPSLL